MTGRAVHVTGSEPCDRKTTGTPDPVGKVVIGDPMAGTWTGAILLPLLPRLLREGPPPGRCD